MRGPSCSGRPGATLPELILVAWLFALVLLGLARFAGAQGRLAALAHDRTRATDLIRTTELILSGELRRAGTSDYALGGDSVRLRAVRGAGPVCGGDGVSIRVRYRGIRQPDPSKDSVVIIADGDTRGSLHVVTDAAADPACPDGYRLRLDPPPAGSTGVALIFESGSYHLSGGAFRYRRGAGGRQPVTEALLSAGWFASASGRIEAWLVLEPDSLPRLGERQAVLSTRLLNDGATP